MPGDPLRDLVLALRRLHRHSGEPSSREISKMVNYSHTTVAKAMGGIRCPSWPVLQAIVRSLGGDEDYFRALWVSVRDATAPLGDNSGAALASDPPQHYNDSANVATAVDIGVPNPSHHQAITDAMFVDQRGVLQAMKMGQVARVSIVMRNTGTTIWSRASSFKLGSQAPHDNELWLPNGANRVFLPKPQIIPEEIADFSFSIRAPRLIGRHSFQWRMVEDGVSWFGERTPSVEIDVT